LQFNAFGMAEDGSNLFLNSYGVVYLKVILHFFVQYTIYLDLLTDHQLTCIISILNFIFYNKVIYTKKIGEIAD
jgi:hypothetical protein